MTVAHLFEHIFDEPLTVTRLARELGVNHSNVSRMNQPGGAILRFVAFFDALCTVSPQSAAVLVDYLAARVRPFYGTWSPSDVVAASADFTVGVMSGCRPRRMYGLAAKLARLAVWARDCVGETVRMDDERRAAIGGAA